MQNLLLHHARVFLWMLLLPLLPGMLAAQDFASNMQSQPTGTERARARSLKETLKEIERRFQVDFVYQENVVAQQYVQYSPAENQALEQHLKNLLAPIGLDFQRIDPSLYAIVLKPIERRPEVIRQPEPVVSLAEKNISHLRMNEIRLEKLVLTVKGQVTDDNNQTLPGVSVLLKGTTIGTATDAEGRFTLSVPDGQENGVLVFSFIGYLSQEMPIGNRTTIDVKLLPDVKSLSEVVVVGYGTQRKETLTGSVATITSKDLERVHATTVSATLAGKLPGVSFRMPDGRPGAGATIQIRNMGDPLYVIDGIQKDAGQFNNISPNDIESISVLKDASAAIYGSRAANGVVIVTTKQGKAGTRNTFNIDAYYGVQNWARFPETTNNYQWQMGLADADMNQFGTTQNHSGLTPAELEKYRQGTEYGYQSFDWYNFIIKKNSPQTSININTTGGTDKLNYYLSFTRLDQNSVLGREFTFARTNIQANVNAQVSKRLKLGTQINGRIEVRDNPGVPGGDDYWAPRFALFYNRPSERPYANDNPNYINKIRNNETNWGYLNKRFAGYSTDTWRVMQANFTGEYEFPIKGLTGKALYSYYMADQIHNGHEYTYDAYTYHPDTEEYERTGGSTNPWRERRQRKIFEFVMQGHLNYNNTFGKHTVGATFVAERIERNDINQWVRTNPQINALPLLQYADYVDATDSDVEEARVGYVGRLNYTFADKYLLEVSARRDASWKFAPGKRWGFFPSVSAGWRITEENFFKNLNLNALSELKLRASYGLLGDDNIPIGPFDYLVGYNYNSSKAIIDGNTITASRQNRPVPINNVSWFTSKIFDVGLDYTLLNGKISGTIDYFRRRRDGLIQTKQDILVPNELGYSLPPENLRSDSQVGGEVSLAYNGNAGDLTFSVGGNVSYSRRKNLTSYKPELAWGNSLDYYYNSQENRWAGTYWGYEVTGQFQSQDQINDYPVNIDGEGNRTLLPGDLIYKDIDGDGRIGQGDYRPIGYARDQNPTVNYGLNFSFGWKGFDLRADFSGGTMYSYNQGWEMRWPYQNGGALLKQFYEDRWHREDLFNPDSPWVPGTYPALRFNKGDHSNYNRSSTFWLTNVRYLRMRTLELGYNLPKSLVDKLKMQRARVYINTYNLFSIDNLSDIGVEPEILDENGLQYPQNRLINVGVNLSF
jgi:TonB-linked SusC/RagA family outer membrane protein